MLLISANEHNLSVGYPLTFVGWPTEGRSAERRKERGGKSRCCSF